MCGSRVRALPLNVRTEASMEAISPKCDPVINAGPLRSIHATSRELTLETANRKGKNMAVRLNQWAMLRSDYVCKTPYVH